jgi:hypothetical protein
MLDNYKAPGHVRVGLPRPGRAEAGKLASPDTLRELAGRHDLFSPVPGREGLEVDNTSPAPEEVAGLVVSHYHLPAARAASTFPE